MNLIDVHIIFTPGFDSEADRDRMLAQLADEPVNVHVIQGSDNTLNNSRIRGYQSGVAPFVTYVDPDDMIQPGAFRKLAAAIHAFPDCSYFSGNEYVSTKNLRKFLPFKESRIVFNVLHSLQVMRRDCVNPELWNQYGEMDYVRGQGYLVYLDAIEKSGELVYLDLPLYDWRRFNPASVSRSAKAVVDFKALHGRLLAANPKVTLLSEQDFDGNDLVGRGVEVRLPDLFPPPTKVFLHPPKARSQSQRQRKL
jgi:hypothetical protein